MRLERLLVYGAGGHGKVVWDTLTLCGHEVVGFVDDGRHGELTLGVPTVRSIELAPGHDAVVVAIGNNQVRQAVYRRLHAAGVRIASAIHPSAVISRHASLGPGVVAMANVVVNIGSVVAENVILNTGARIDHDARIEAHAHIAPGTVLAGNVQVGEGAFLGIGCRVIPGRRIGDWATVGAGAVVIRDVAPRSTVVGVPARPLASQEQA